jgi:hypothetical protein
VLTICSEVSKRSADEVNWSEVTYDLSNVKWDEVFPSTPAAVPAATPTPVAPKVEAPVVEDVPSSAAAVVPSATPTPAYSAPAPAKSSEAPSLGDIVDDVKDLLHGVEDTIKSMGFKGVGINDKSNNGGLWIGDDGAWKTEFTNDGSGDMVVFCWKADGFSGMSLNVNLPAISVGLKQGESVTVSFAPNVPAACAPAFSDTKMANFGGVCNTWYEATFGKDGAFDVSRNVNMNGNGISAKGSKCVSNMDSCVFKCQDESASSCETGYTLAGMDSAGCGGGYDAVMAGVGGGCSVGAEGETVKVTFT